MRLESLTRARDVDANVRINLHLFRNILGMDWYAITILFALHINRKWLSLFRQILQMKCTVKEYFGVARFRKKLSKTRTKWRDDGEFSGKEKVGFVVIEKIPLILWLTLQLSSRIVSKTKKTFKDILESMKGGLLLDPIWRRKGFYSPKFKLLLFPPSLTKCMTFSKAPTLSGNRVLDPAQEF